MNSSCFKNSITKRLFIIFLCGLLIFVNLFTFVQADDNALADTFPEYSIGNNREVIYLDGEWSWTTYSIDNELPEAIPVEMDFSVNKIDLPSYTPISVENPDCFIFYKKSFYLSNSPRESVVINYGVDVGAEAVYVNNIKCDTYNISKFLSAGKNDIVIVKENCPENRFHFTDQISLIFSNAPVITSSFVKTDINNGTVEIDVQLFNAREEALKTDINVELFNNDNLLVGEYLLEDVEVLEGAYTTANVTGIKINNYSDSNKWQSSKPNVYCAKISVSGDTVVNTFAMTPADLFGSENNKFGMDIKVSEFFANSNNKGFTWNKAWIKSLFNYFKEFNWTVITYRDGSLPYVWFETALEEGILLIDKNGDEKWQQSQDSLWTKDIDFVSKAKEIKSTADFDYIIPVVYNGVDGLFAKDPAFTGYGKTRLQNTFNNSYTAPSTDNEVKEDKGFIQNIISYFKEMINKTFIRDNRYKLFLTGLMNTLLVTAAALLFGVLIGIIIAVIKVAYTQGVNSKKKNPVVTILNFIAETYTAIIRGTPVVVQLLITYNVIFVFSDEAVLIGIFAFSINSGAYISEIIRAGINSVDKGQTEAGRSLGLSQFTTMKSIVLPQALKNILPALGNEFIALLKETSVIGYLGVVDLTRAGELVRSRTADAFFTLIFVAIVYFVLVFGLSTLIKYFERRLNKSDKN